jgi:prolipoprotein diacylglyceryltransferase
VLASIPSPGHAAWRLGPLPVRAQALCVIAGIGVAVLVTAHRYRRACGPSARSGVILDVAAWAIPFGLIGALLHAVLLDTRHDFRHMYQGWHVLTVGVAAIGVPGAVALGALGAWIACRRAGVQLSPVAGAAAPAIALGLAVGGLGNWWTQQFYGPPSTWWWAVQISPGRGLLDGSAAYRPGPACPGHAARRRSGYVAVRRGRRRLVRDEATACLYVKDVRKTGRSHAGRRFFR